MENHAELRGEGTETPPWGRGHPRSTGQGKVRGVQGTSGWQHRCWHRCRRDAEPLLAFWTPVATCPSSSPPASPLSTLSPVPNPTPVIYACEKDLAWGSGERWLCPSLRCSMGWVQPPLHPQSPPGAFCSAVIRVQGTGVNKSARGGAGLDLPWWVHAGGGSPHPPWGFLPILF